MSLAASSTELAAREVSEEINSIALPAKAIEIVENYPSLISMTLILQNNTKITWFNLHSTYETERAKKYVG